MLTTEKSEQSKTWWANLKKNPKKKGIKEETLRELRGDRKSARVCLTTGIVASGQMVESSGEGISPLARKKRTKGDEGGTPLKLLAPAEWLGGEKDEQRGAAKMKSFWVRGEASSGGGARIAPV